MIMVRWAGQGQTRVREGRTRLDGRGRPSLRGGGCSYAEPKRFVL